MELSQLTEGYGYDAMWAGDSVLAKPRLDSISVLSAAAGATNRVRLGTACFASFPLRHPILLAYQWATLDVISEGRSLLVICQGTPTHHGKIYRNEFDALGVHPKEKVQRIEEGIEILRKLWEGDDVSYNGQICKFKDVTMLPKPVQKPCPPRESSGTGLKSIPSSTSTAKTFSPAPCLSLISLGMVAWPFSLP